MPDPHRAALGALGAHISWANTRDRSARTAAARGALEAKFLAEADGDPVRAAHLRKAHYRRLAMKSAEVRRIRKVAAQRVSPDEQRARSQARVKAARDQVRRLAEGSADAQP